VTFGSFLNKAYRNAPVNRKVIQTLFHQDLTSFKRHYYWPLKAWGMRGEDRETARE